MNKTLKYIIFGLGIYLLAAGSSYAIFSSQSGSNLVSPLADQQDQQNSEPTVFTGPATEECPINGALYPKEQEKVWQSRRPLLVMIENHEDSRPQSGLSRADIVYETVAEGGITRFMGVFYCKAAEPASKKYDLGPVRSARTYFLDWASEYSDYPLYVHVGGAHCSPANGDSGPCTTNVKAQALEQIGKYGWLDPDHRNDMNQFALSYKECRREPDRTGQSRATEHTMYCDSEALWALAANRGLEAKTEATGDSWNEDFEEWLFKDEAKLADRGSVDQLSFDFWKGYGAYKVTWNYNKDTNRYLRENGGQVQNEFLTQQQLSAKVVVIQFSKETGPVDDHKHMLYQTTGSGKALIFQDGQAISASWSKKSRQDRTIFKDAKGKEIEFNRGLIWIEVLPDTNQVDYEAA